MSLWRRLNSLSTLIGCSNSRSGPQAHLDSITACSDAAVQPQQLAARPAVDPCMFIRTVSAVVCGDTAHQESQLKVAVEHSAVLEVSSFVKFGPFLVLSG